MCWVNWFDLMFQFFWKIFYIICVPFCVPLLFWCRLCQQQLILLHLLKVFCSYLSLTIWEQFKLPLFHYCFLNPILQICLQTDYWSCGGIYLPSASLSSLIWYTLKLCHVHLIDYFYYYKVIFETRKLFFVVLCFDSYKCFL